ncbi:hypothetical protein FHS35_009148 [Streptomyces umbrinus]|uniref:hypothetical protein n=1 Tax=Streptomyces umbrinus TaxID=67370 RepID=UPI00214DEC4C|nr:hypothetical protein [Streptomyces umbrinus]MCR3732230.1 hypothetical protein [Streptomyces umbrinus]
MNAAQKPVRPGPAVLVPTRSDRALATQQWLLSTLDEEGRSRAQTEWAEHRMALLSLGTLFSAVRIPGRLVHVLADPTEPADADAFLSDTLDGGPVICDPNAIRYYALVPASTPEKWREAAEGWRSLGVEVLGRGTVLGVPRVDVVEFDPCTYSSYWSVSMSSAAMLCEPRDVARLIAAGRHQLEAEADA